jgi:hypothetical protein
MVPVVADADTLFGATTRGLLIHLDCGGLIRLHWSPLILEELSRALVVAGRKADAKAARQRENLMRTALPHADIPTAEVQAEGGWHRRLLLCASHFARHPRQINCCNDSPPMDKLKPQQPCMQFGAKTWRRFDPAVVQQVLGAPTFGRQQEVVLHTATVIVSFGPLCTGLGYEQLNPMLAHSPQHVTDNAVLPSTIRLKWASTITEIRTRALELVAGMPWRAPVDGLSWIANDLIPGHPARG